MGLLDTTGFWIIAGFVSKARLLSEGTLVKRLPTQTDMIAGGRRWIRPGNESDLVRPSNLVDGISGNRKAYGGQNFRWPMLGLSPKMVAFIHTTYFDDDWWAELTVQTFNRATGNWEAYQATTQFANYKDEAELAMGGYNNFMLTFVNADVAPDGPDAKMSASGAAVWTVGIVGAWTLIVSNIGDDATFDDLVVTHALPVQMLFNHTVAAGWSIEWSSNGTTYFNIVNNPPPIPRNDVRYVRYTYTPSVDAGADAPTILLYVEPDLTATITSIFTVTMTGDTNTANDTVTLVVVALPRGFDSGFSNGFGVSPSAFYLPAFSNGFGLPVTGFSNGFSNGFSA